MLAGECYECHSAKKQKGGLRLDSRDALLKGGENGPAIVRGNAKKSLLITAITHERDDLKMPEKGVKLDGEVIENFIAWVNMGAPDPRDSPPAELTSAGSSWDATLAARKTWWSFQPVQKPTVPTSKNAGWSEHPVDRFLLTKMEERGLQPASPAELRVLIRRLHFALTGLPPKPEEIEAFVGTVSLSPSLPVSPSSAKDRQTIRQGDKEIEQMVDALLASPQFGEHWARHWMDLVRYAETHGSEGDPEIREAWRYRDYLIRAFDTDVPVDQLIREHIAGDLLPNPRLNLAEGLNESIHGIASLRFTEHGYQPVDTLDEQVKTIENQIDVLGKSFQGLTLACARCHDHKFDPIGQRDFYALFGILASSRPAQVTVDAPEVKEKSRAELTALKSQIKTALADEWLAALEKLPARLLGETPDDRDLSSLRQRVSEIEEETGELEAIARAKVNGARAARPRVGAASDEPAGGPPALLPPPISRWSFDRDARDQVGNLHGELLGGATVRNGRLVLDGQEAHFRSATFTRDLSEKTLEAWVALGDLDQRGGGVITIESAKGSIFDSIVFAEKAAKKWVNGSNNFRRSKVVEGADETAKPGELVHLAVVYRADNSIAIYRNGEPYAPPYTPSGPESTLHTFTAGDAHVLLGRRHTGGGHAFLAGEIDEARLYDRALTDEQIAASFRAGPAGVSEEELAAAMMPEQREKFAGLKTELARAQTELKSREEKAGADAWRTELAEAARNPQSPLHVWASLHDKPAADFARAWEELSASQSELTERTRRANREGFTLKWDLARDGAQWFKNGSAFDSGAGVSPAGGTQSVSQTEGQAGRLPHIAGEFAIEPVGERVVTGIYPAGFFTHALSQKDAGLLTSPRFKIETDNISVLAAGGRGSMVRVIVDNYPLNNGQIFQVARLESDEPKWIRMDTSYRKGTWAYLEFANYDDLTHPILAKGKDRPADGRSWFGAWKVAMHDGKEAPKKENVAAGALLAGVAPENADALAKKYQRTLADAVSAWRAGKADEAQCALLDYFVRRGLLPNSLGELPSVTALVGGYRSLEAEVPVPRRAPGLIEGTTYDAPLMPRGDHLKPGEPVPRGYLQVLGKTAFSSTEVAADVRRLTSNAERGTRNVEKSQSLLTSAATSGRSGRLELADAIASPANPLTARVMVNRIWHQLFGRGLVPTTDNFGRLGEKPTHPELLDYLAAKFVEDGWSTKKMIRFLVTSRAWQMSSEASAQAREADAANELLSHFRVRRLEAEAIRDSMLAVSGELDSTMFGKPVSTGDRTRRSIYLAVRRNSLSAFLEAFDSPKPFTTLGKRDVTNVPAQSLALLNDPFVIHCAARWAKSAMQNSGDATAEARARRMFMTATGRAPTAAEQGTMQEYLAALAQAHGAGGEQSLESPRVWQDFAQSLFNLKEFIYVR
ncbi:MAG: DUF1553 domain-containing protein [Verrucomicrobia bacterium]|nr:DUF1553 domain-containing protein [Verrucomicrobiota bacterium]